MEQISLSGYMDIHSHILPGVDDGAADMEEALEMIQMAYKEGVRIIVLTPHNYPGEDYNNELVHSRYEELVSAVGSRYDDIILMLGNEIFYRDSIVTELRQGGALTLGKTLYVLVEFDYRIEFNKLYQGVRRLVEGGYRPIIAHIERYDCLFKQYIRIQELIELGAYIQVNCRSIMGGLLDQGAVFCKKLLEKNMIHFLGSDCHNLTSRTPQMASCLKHLRKKGNQTVVEKISVSNVERLFYNKYIDN